MNETNEEQRADLDGIEVSPRGARPLAITSFVFAVAALIVVPIITGVLGMVTGSIAHLKGDSLGMKGAVASGITMILGMALQALVFGSGGIAS